MDVRDSRGYLPVGDDAGVVNSQGNHQGGRESPSRSKGLIPQEAANFNASKAASGSLALTSGGGRHSTIAERIWPWSLLRTAAATTKDFLIATSKLTLRWPRVGGFYASWPRLEFTQAFLWAREAEQICLRMAGISGLESLWTKLFLENQIMSIVTAEWIWKSWASLWGLARSEWGLRIAFILVEMGLAIKGG